MPASVPYKILLVGCGGITNSWLSACREHFSERIRITGFVDLNEAAARARAAEYAPGAWTGVSLSSALAALRPDVVFNCTVPDAHFGVTTAALEAGAHVLSEKPLAPGLADGLRMRATASSTGRTLAVIQNYRCVRAARTVRHALASGIIGNLHTINADFFLAPRFGGFREKMRHVLLRDMAIHTFDAARFFSGADPRSVFCHESNPRGSWYSEGASASAIFEMTGGIVFNYRGSWCAQGCPTPWNSAWRFIGDKGTLLWDGGEIIQADHILPWDGREFLQPVKTSVIPPLPHEPAKEGHAGMIGEFLDALDSKTQPSTRVDDNLQSVAMVEQAIQSAETGKQITIQLQP
jgi:predicted dehydrogenase